MLNRFKSFCFTYFPLRLLHGISCKITRNSKIHRGLLNRGCKHLGQNPPHVLGFSALLACFYFMLDTRKAQKSRFLLLCRGPIHGTLAAECPYGLMTSSGTTTGSNRKEQLLLPASAGNNKYSCDCKWLQLTGKICGSLQHPGQGKLRVGQQRSSRHDGK